MQVHAASLATLVLLAANACGSLPEATARSEHRVASADGVPLVWEERGSGAPTLVFVHGWCGERGFWSATMDAFAPAQRCLALDLAGHGSSGAARAEWTLSSLADDVVAVVTDSGADDVILIGHSLGATVALLATPRLAPRVRGVIGVDSLHDVDFAYPPGFLASAAVELEADFPRALEASLRGVTGRGISPELLDWIQARALRTDRGAAVGLLRGLEGFELGEALRGAGVPVRVINAAPRSGSELVTALEKNRTLADFDALLLEESGHFPMLEQPARFQPLLRHWVDELSKPTAR